MGSPVHGAVTPSPTPSDIEAPLLHDPHWGVVLVVGLLVLAAIAAVLWWRWGR